MAAELFVDTRAWYPLVVAAHLAFARTVGESPNVVVRGTREPEETAVREWLERYDDRDFSLADAVSFAVMAERGIEDALTLDHHFAVAGFRVVAAAGEREPPGACATDVPY